MASLKGEYNNRPYKEWSKRNEDLYTYDKGYSGFSGVPDYIRAWASRFVLAVDSDCGFAQIGANLPANLSKHLLFARNRNLGSLCRNARTVLPRIDGPEELCFPSTDQRGTFAGSCPLKNRIGKSRLWVWVRYGRIAKEREDFDRSNTLLHKRITGRSARNRTDRTEPPKDTINRIQSTDHQKNSVT